jgi:hypothetical protein
MRRAGTLAAALVATAVVAPPPAGALGSTAGSAPASVAGAVEVSDTSAGRRTPCPPVDSRNPRELRGGCVVDMISRDIEVLVRTVVGDTKLGDCLYRHDMRVDARGRTYLEGIGAGGPSPCNDLEACDRHDVRPWHGQIEAAPDGRLTHVVDACFDTCMGQFAGELRLTLERVGNRWAQIADRALVGDSGYRLDGGWDVERRNLDIRPAAGDAAGPGDPAAALLPTGAWQLTG